MSANEFLVVCVFGYLGYLLVNVFIKKDHVTSDSNDSSNSSSQFEPENKESNNYQKAADSSEDIENSWFKILDIPKTAGREIITAAYKRKISQYHPDKVATLGSELRDLAEFKSKQINAAYVYAIKIRG